MASTGESPIKLVLGTANVGDTSIDPMARFNTPDEVNGFINAFAARGYHQLDNARVYSPHAPGSSEPRLGAVAAGDRFVIDTKVNSLKSGTHTKENILKEVDLSLEALKIKQINIEYLHMPDRATKFEEACEAMNQAHREGKIKHWGLSNYKAEEVQAIVKICEERGFVKPTVYQGQYNLIVRGGEKELFPILRKNGISFYAYSPAAAGFFAGNHKKVKAGGRYDQSLILGGIYSQFYLKPSIMAATDKALEIASGHGISGHAAALRWTAYHSQLNKAHGDAIIIGASSPEQLESNIDMIEQGALPDDVVAALEAVYKEIGDEVSYHIRLRMANYMREKNNAKVSQEIAVVSTKDKQLSASPDETRLLVPRAIPGAFEHEPLASFIRSLDSKEVFMFDYYVNVVVPYLDLHCPVMKHLGGDYHYRKQNWILFSSTEVELLKGFLLAACRHLYIVHLEKEFGQLAIQYKLNYVRSLRETISATGPASSRMAVTKALVLGIDEVSLMLRFKEPMKGEPWTDLATEIMLGDLSMAIKHVIAAAEIVHVAGGPQALGLSGIVQYILDRCLQGHRRENWDPLTDCDNEFMKPETAWSEVS
ncbi:Aldo-ket-red domain-containing protein [Fusarium sp. LHS14.1]|nr:Aldo-ket-red domain-containing protein [Fusarium sp. LHS14.1]